MPWLSTVNACVHTCIFSDDTNHTRTSCWWRHQRPGPRRSSAWEPPGCIHSSASRCDGSRDGWWTSSTGSCLGNKKFALQSALLVNTGQDWLGLAQITDLGCPLTYHCDTSRTVTTLLPLVFINTEYCTAHEETLALLCNDSSIARISTLYLKSEPTYCMCKLGTVTFNKPVKDKMISREQRKQYLKIVDVAKTFW